MEKGVWNRMKIEIITSENKWDCIVTDMSDSKIDAVLMRQIASALIKEADKKDGKEKEKHMLVKNSGICSICNMPLIAGKCGDTVTVGKELIFAHGKCWDNQREWAWDGVGE
jgi:hypothetical protein